MNYSIYITTNQNRTSLYVGVTNNLEQRIIEHYLNKGNPSNFAGKYYCYLLVYYESHQYINDAIAREKQIKGWSRKKKERLIESFNSEWKFLNVEIFQKWPPVEHISIRNS